MSALVLKQWTLSDQALDPSGTRIVITGREGGVVPWLLSLTGVDPTTSIRVSPERVEFVSSSLAGTNHRLLPLVGVCSTFFGYYKPWKQAAAIFLAIAFLGYPLVLAFEQRPRFSASTLLVLLLVGAVTSFAYYLLNRTMTLGFVENSGVINAIQFRPSIIEGISINDSEARRVCEYVQALIEHKLRSLAGAP